MLSHCYLHNPEAQHWKPAPAKATGRKGLSQTSAPLVFQFLSSQTPDALEFLMLLTHCTLVPYVFQR